MSSPSSTGPFPFQALISYIEHDAVPMIVLDPDYNIVGANLSYQRQFAGGGRSYLGHKCYRVSHQYTVPCDRAGEHCPMKQAIATRAPDRVLHIHHTPRGPEHVDVELRPILDDQENVIAFVERLTPVHSASPQPRIEGLVGRSPAFNEAIAALQRAAPAQISVLLQGESGTGKEMFARALHAASARASGPLVVVDCTGLSESLFESEVFGHERGAFTGAATRKIGLAETAHGGTLFLDEIGDVSLPMQVKLLRLIESGTFRRVGGIETLRSDFRLVSATHKPLEAMVDAGSFRQDLYYRISAFPIHLPSLRERPGDIPLLVASLIDRISPGGGVHVEPDAMRRLKQYPFPGNVRELRNILERARLFSDDGAIRERDLAPRVRGETRTTSPGQLARSGSLPRDERERLAHALTVFRGTRAELAKHLKMSQRTLYRRLRELGLE